METEPVPLYAVSDSAYFNNEPVLILAIQTYCSCCDRFYEEAKYSIKAISNEWVKHRVPESKIQFSLEE